MLFTRSPRSEIEYPSVLLASVTKSSLPPPLTFKSDTLSTNIDMIYHQLQLKLSLTSRLLSLVNGAILITSPKICFVFSKGWRVVELAAVATTSTPPKLAGVKSRQKSSARIVGFVDGVNYYQLTARVLSRVADSLHVLVLVDCPVHLVSTPPVSSSEHLQVVLQFWISFPSVDPRYQFERHLHISFLHVSLPGYQRGGDSLPESISLSTSRAAAIAFTTAVFPHPLPPVIRSGRGENVDRRR